MIVLMGPVNAGKDTVGQILVDDFGFTRLAFADHLKDLTTQLIDDVFAAPRSSFDDRVQKEQPIYWSWSPDFWFWSMTIAVSLSCQLGFLQFGGALFLGWLWGMYSRPPGPTRREWLAKLGQVIRTNFHDNYFAQYTLGQAAQLSESEARVVITDCRFKPEVDELQKLGYEGWEIQFWLIQRINQSKKAPPQYRPIVYPSLTIYNTGNHNQLKKFISRVMS